MVMAPTTIPVSLLWTRTLGKYRDLKNKRAMDIEAERSRNGKKRTEGRRGRKIGFCGAKKRDGGKCRRSKGAGTDHPGIGHCALHGGTTPTQRLNSAKQTAVLMGAPKEINPVDALYWCIKITAGEVEWLNEQIVLLDKKDWIEESMLGKQMHLFVRERKEAVERLAGFSKQAISLGLAERAVRLAENYGVALSRLLKGVLDDLELTNYQRELAPVVVRKHLVLLEGSSPIQDEDRKAITAGEAA
jgi:hypothetical protein